MRIANHQIGSESPCFIIAELSANHNGSLDTALETIKAAKRAGADAIKLQTYTADSITLDVKNEFFRISGTEFWDERYLYDLYKEAYTPYEWHKTIFAAAKEEGLVCFSSPFDLAAVDFLESLDTPAYKIASFEITDIPLIQYVAKQQKPVIISTGIATEEDINNALEACRAEGNNDIGLLQCTSSYPAPLELANLTMIEDFQRRFNVIPGLSDHTLGQIAPIVAVAKGAKIIEKHFIINKEIGGPDAGFSLDESEFKTMVDAVREAEKSIGIVNYELTEAKIKNRKYRRSLFVCEDVKAGDLISTSNVRSVRPGDGMAPIFLDRIIGQTFSKDSSKGTPLTEALISQP